MNRVLIIIALALALVAMQVSRTKADGGYVYPQGTITYENPVYINTSPAPGGIQGMLGIGNEATVDGDALLFAKHTFINHGGQMVDAQGNVTGVGNAHVVNSALYWMSTEYDHSGLIIASPSRAVLRNGNTKDVSGLFAAAHHLVYLDEGSLGHIARAAGAWSDLQVMSTGASIGLYDGYYVRGITGTVNEPLVDNFRGYAVGAVSKATSSAIGINIGTMNAPYARSIMLEGYGKNNAIQMGAQGPSIWSLSSELFLETDPASERRTGLWLVAYLNGQTTYREVELGESGSCGSGYRCLRVYD